MNNTPKTKSFLVALIIIIGLIFLNFPKISNNIRNYFYLILAPAQEILDDSVKAIRGGWMFFKDLKSLYLENNSLKDKINQLQSQNTELKEIKRENEFLRSYFNLPNEKKYEIYLANIVGKDFQGLDKYFLIDKGKRDNIKKDMPVIVFNNILIGKIDQVFDSSSTVLLITSSNSKIPALIQESRMEGLIQGITRNDRVVMDLVSKEAKAEIGQSVITSGIDNVFPGGLLIGAISKVELFEEKIFKDVEVVLPIEINQLEQLFIIKGIE